VLVAQAALVGDKHKFVSALISPNFPRWKIGQSITELKRSRARNWW